MRAGNLNKRVRFLSLSQGDDGGGGGDSTWSTYLTVWAAFRPDRVSERLESGRVTAETFGRLTVRMTSDTREIQAKDRCVIDDLVYEIVSGSVNPDQRNKALDFMVQTVAGAVPPAWSLDFSHLDNSQYLALFEDV